MWHTSGARGAAAREARVAGLDQFGGAVLFLGAGLWLAWMLGGALVSRRRAAAVSRWAHAEVRPYGKQLELRWVTTARFELTVTDARAPFKQLALTGHLQARAI